MTMMSHRLPEDPEERGDATWFHRLNKFERQETRRQVIFKRRQWPDLPDGCWSGRRGYSYPHILPGGHEEKNVYPPIHRDLLQYLEQECIAQHREWANLRSSQVCCLNFLFPLRQQIGAAAAALSPLLPRVKVVDQIEFEYTGPDGATAWLGEPPGGKRGQNRTSVDAAVWWHDADDGSRLTLVEWKYTEKQFGTCGGLASRGNDQKAKCRGWAGLDFRASRDCYLARGETERNQRRYWEHLAEAGIDLASYQGTACPFCGPAYQLVRLHLLGAYLQRENAAAKVDVAAVHFSGDKSLATPPVALRHLGADMTSAWRRLLRQPDDYRVCHAEELAQAIRNSAVDSALAEYLHERYGV